MQTERDRENLKVFERFAKTMRVSQFSFKPDHETISWFSGKQQRVTEAAEEKITTVTVFTASIELSKSQPVEERS